MVATKACVDSFLVNVYMNDVKLVIAQDRVSYKHVV